MGWENRGNGLYDYRKRRDGNRVASEYVGKGISAYLLMELDIEERMEGDYKRAQWNKQRSAVKRTNSDNELLTEIINGYVRAVLLTSGYHPHKGQWRRVRNG